jgi:hypothetical protein
VCERVQRDARAEVDVAIGRGRTVLAGRAVGNRGKTHAGNRSSQLQGNSPTRCAGAHDSDADGPTGSFTSLQQVVNGGAPTHLIYPSRLEL